MKVKATDFSGFSNTQQITILATGEELQPAPISLGLLHVIDNEKIITKANITFSIPENMRITETTGVELLFNPLLSKSISQTPIEEQNSIGTNTADLNSTLVPADQFETSPRTKVVLLPQDPEVFNVKEMHDNAEQVISSIDATTWRWSVTAKKGGSHALELVIYRLVKYDGKEFWQEVETYKANIVIKVTLANRAESFDWKWIVATLLIPLVASLWAWWRSRNKSSDVMQVKIVDEKKNPKRKKRND